MGYAQRSLGFLMRRLVYLGWTGVHNQRRWTRMLTRASMGAPLLALVLLPAFLVSNTVSAQTTTPVPGPTVFPAPTTSPTPTPGGGGGGNAANVEQFSWDFGDWFTGSKSDVQASISDGKYSITVGPGQAYFFTPNSVPTGTDQAVQADLDLKAGYAGVAVRYSKDSNGDLNYYDCFLNDDGTYGCGVEVGGNWKAIIDATATPVIKKGQVNTLQVTAIGSSITVTINGTDVNTFTDSQLKTGEIALEVGSPSQDTNGQASFTKVKAEIIAQ